jgi:hypothetical protein
LRTSLKILKTAHRHWLCVRWGSNKPDNYGDSVTTDLLDTTNQRTRQWKQSV